MKAPCALVPPSSKLIPPSSASVTANAIASHSFPRPPGSANGVDGKEKLEKFSDLWTTSKVGYLWRLLFLSVEGVSGTKLENVEIASIEIALSNFYSSVCFLHCCLKRM